MHVWQNPTVRVSPCQGDETEAALLSALHSARQKFDTAIAAEKPQFSQAVVDVEERTLKFTLCIAPELRGRDVDFPVPIAGRAGVVGKQWWTALCQER
jgi:hypothetical protein